MDASHPSEHQGVPPAPSQTSTSNLSPGPPPGPPPSQPPNEQPRPLFSATMPHVNMGPSEFSISGPSIQNNIPSELTNEMRQLASNLHIPPDLSTNIRNAAHNMHLPSMHMPSIPSVHVPSYLLPHHLPPAHQRSPTYYSNRDSTTIHGISPEPDRPRPMGEERYSKSTSDHKIDMENPTDVLVHEKDGHGDDGKQKSNDKQRDKNRTCTKILRAFKNMIFNAMGLPTPPGKKNKYGGKYRKRRPLHGDEGKSGHDEASRHVPHSVETRLTPTLDDAYEAYDRYTEKARSSGFFLNIAIGLQVVIGALVTGLSAVTTGNHTRVMTSILGGLSTIVASYLARARGSGEPDLSSGKAREMEKLIRDIESYILDWGHETPDMATRGEYDEYTGATQATGVPGGDDTSTTMRRKVPTTRDREISEHIDQFRRQFEIIEGNANKPQKPGTTGGHT